MDIGGLRHRVKLLRRVLTDADGFGQQATDYQEYATVWASVETLTGRELEMARQISATATLKVTVRYHADLTETDRIEFSKRIFEIVAMDNPEQRNELLYLQCSEVRP